MNVRTMRKALRVGMELEQELIPAYEWFIKKSNNEIVQQVLGNILYQKRIHYKMFQHALSMGSITLLPLSFCQAVILSSKASTRIRIRSTSPDE